MLTGVSSALDAVIPPSRPSPAPLLLRHQCASLSIKDDETAATALEQIEADQAALEASANLNRRHLADCESCTGDFAEERTIAGTPTLPRTGSAVMPCDLVKTTDGVQIKSGHDFAVPNMKSRWFAFWGADVTYDFETVADCVREAYLSVHNCYRDTDGKVVVSFTTSDTGLGRCRCVALGKSIAHEAPGALAQSNEYTGSCSPDEMPFLYLPTILTCASRPSPCFAPPLHTPEACLRLVGRRPAGDPVGVVGAVRTTRQGRNGNHARGWDTADDSKMRVHAELGVCWANDFRLLYESRRRSQW